MRKMIPICGEIMKKGTERRTAGGSSDTIIRSYEHKIPFGVSTTAKKIRYKTKPYRVGPMCRRGER